MGQQTLAILDTLDIVDATRRIASEQFSSLVDRFTLKEMINKALNTILLAERFVDTVSMEGVWSDNHFFINYYISADLTNLAVTHVYSVCIDDESQSILSEYKVNFDSEST